MYQFLVATSVVMRCTKPPEDPLHHAESMPKSSTNRVQAEEHRHQDDHDRRGVHFLLRRPRHALQLVAHFAQKQPRALEAPAGRLPDVSSVVVCSAIPNLAQPQPWSLTSSPYSIPVLAGQEGIEPPTPGFGDRCSAN